MFILKVLLFFPCAKATQLNQVENFVLLSEGRQIFDPYRLSRGYVASVCQLDPFDVEGLAGGVFSELASS